MASYNDEISHVKSLINTMQSSLNSMVKYLSEMDHDEVDFKEELQRYDNQFEEIAKEIAAITRKYSIDQLPPNFLDIIGFTALRDRMMRLHRNVDAMTSPSSTSGPPTAFDEGISMMKMQILDLYELWGSLERAVSNSTSNQLDALMRHVHACLTKVATIGITTEELVRKYNPTQRLDFVLTDIGWFSIYAQFRRLEKKINGMMVGPTYINEQDEKPTLEQPDWLEFGPQPGDDNLREASKREAIHPMEKLKQRIQAAEQMILSMGGIGRSDGDHTQLDEWLDYIRNILIITEEEIEGQLDTLQRIMDEHGEEDKLYYRFMERYNSLKFLHDRVQQLYKMLYDVDPEFGMRWSRQDEADQEPTLEQPGWLDFGPQEGDNNLREASLREADGDIDRPGGSQYEMGKYPYEFRDRLKMHAKSYAFLRDAMRPYLTGVDLDDTYTHWIFRLRQRMHPETVLPKQERPTSPDGITNDPVPTQYADDSIHPDTTPLVQLDERERQRMERLLTQCQRYSAKTMELIGDMQAAGIGTSYIKITAISLFGRLRDVARWIGVLEERLGLEPSMPDIPELGGEGPDGSMRQAGLQDVRDKAKRLVDRDAVLPETVTPSRIEAKVVGDHNTYHVMLNYGNKWSSGGPEAWSCTCLWGYWAKLMRRFHLRDRMCSHAMATSIYFENIRWNLPDEGLMGDQTLTIPGAETALARPAPINKRRQNPVPVPAPPPTPIIPNNGGQLKLISAAEKFKLEYDPMDIINARYGPPTYPDILDVDMP